MIEEHAPGVQHMLPFHLVTRGPIWFDVPGFESIRLDDGDVIVLPHGADHSLTDRPGTPGVPVAELRHAVKGYPPTLAWGGQGEPSEALCGFFHCNGRLFNPLLAALPEVLVVRHDPARSPWLTATLERTFDETLEARAGGAALIGRLTELLFLEVVQRYVEDCDGTGWLSALNDPVVGAALDRLHARPDYPWTLDELAREVGASRSTLSDRFTTVVGLSPIRYLIAWRMELAAERLEDTRDRIAEIAAAIGYDSEASFNRAFKRHTGEPPASWRRRQLSAQAVLQS
ncbi:MAG: helix-turn-helix domain-containing protein [Dehalococcoidia bacterium]|nr:helix-turn-helix domain-containing protein [Dehalococcoidia bacterium]